jgi:hypothetical protein
MTTGLFIASAAGWDERRRAPLKRLQGQLPGAVTVVSEVKEHASVWSRRLYARALASKHDHLLFLNDDVIVCPEFERVIGAMVAAVPDQVISLHTGLPEASELRAEWLRSYLVNGPAYLYPRAMLSSLFEFCEALPKVMRDRMNEDEVAAHHLWSLQQPAWHCVPALVNHDTSVPSTLGYDNHPMRGSSNSDWAHMPHDWTVRGEPKFCPHPWLSEKRMMQVKIVMTAGEDPMICGFCAQRPGFFTSSDTGIRICAECVSNITRHVFENLRTA